MTSTAGVAGEDPTVSPDDVHIPVTTASGTDVRAPGWSDKVGSGGGGGISGVAPFGGPALADDASVLPVPNHVVLHHLSTSAIKNGVLAVGNTTRYKKKVRSFRFLVQLVDVLI